MIDFLNDYKYYFLLGASLLLPFILSLYNAIVRNQKTRVVVFLITMGFIITLSMAVLNDIQKRNSDRVAAELEKKKEAIISEISDNVFMTMRTSTESLKTVIETKGISEKSLTLLEKLERQLAGKGFADVAVTLVGMGEENLLEFNKGNISQLPRYARWLAEVSGDEGAAGHEPALSLVLNAGHTYRLEMLLGYLVVTTENAGGILSGLSGNEAQWRKFPEGSGLTLDELTTATTRYVLFYDRDKQHLMGYADATVFVRELLLLKQNGKTVEIESYLNEGGAATAGGLGARFASFDAAVIQAATPYDAARALIDGNHNEAVTIYQDTPWRVSLARIVELAV